MTFLHIQTQEHISNEITAEGGPRLERNKLEREQIFAYQNFSAPSIAQCFAVYSE